VVFAAAEGGKISFWFLTASIRLAERAAQSSLAA
jgi:hypothetical protein